MQTKLISLMLMLVASSLLNARATVDVTVVEENGTPIEGAEVRVVFSHITPVTGRKEKIVTESTDEEGKVSASGSANLGMSLDVKKDGYYSYGLRPALRDEFAENKSSAPIDKRVILRRIIDPIGLHTKRVFDSSTIHGDYVPIPVEGEWIGFDFEKGDWLKPHGTGENADILFRYNKEFKGFRESPWRTLDQRRESNRKKFERLGLHWDEEVFKKQGGLWDGVLEIGFPGEKEGIVKVEDAFNVHSVLRMPHQAPEEGYAESHSYSVNHEEPPANARDDIGYFLRTRVVLDRQGNIESANYAKIYGEIDFRAIGAISFTYYYNPVANDRNLEFDPKQNLFPEDVEGSRVFLP